MLEDEAWRHQLGEAFAGLTPEPDGPAGMTGSLAAAYLGDVSTFRVTGTPQVVRRSPRLARTDSPGLLKACLPTRGHAVLHQGGREVPIGVGRLALYDTRRPYDLRLEGSWACEVMTVPAEALGLPQRQLEDLMGRTHDTRKGAGRVLRSFLATATDQYAEARTVSALRRFGDAGLGLLASTLAMDAVPDELARAADGGREALRLRVLDHLETHVRDPSLSHASVAAALGMSPRTLDRLFEDQPRSVTSTLRVLRLEGARRELVDPGAARLGVQAIAAHWCFVDAPHFSRTFKSHFGLSPSQVRADAASARTL